MRAVCRIAAGAVMSAALLGCQEDKGAALAQCDGPRLALYRQLDAEHKASSLEFDRKYGLEPRHVESLSIGCPPRRPGQTKPADVDFAEYYGLPPGDIYDQFELERPSP
jgi:hypothetical protein